MPEITELADRLIALEARFAALTEQLDIEASYRGNTVCAEAGCPELVRGGEYYCADHFTGEKVRQLRREAREGLAAEWREQGAS